VEADANEVIQTNREPREIAYKVIKKEEVNHQ